jgi:hypothetical protein
MCRCAPGLAFNPLSTLIPSQDFAFVIQQKNRLIFDRIDEFAKEVVALLKPTFVLSADLCLIKCQPQNLQTHGLSLIPVLRHRPDGACRPCA